MAPRRSDGTATPWVRQRFARRGDPRALIVRVGGAAMAALGLAASAPPSLAQAYEDQATFEIGLGYAHAFARGLPASGPSLAVAGSVGLGDVWTLRAMVGGSVHPALAGEASTTVVPFGGAELLYVVDVLRWVPYLGLGVDAVGTVSNAGAGADLAAHALLGLDWLASRAWIVGIDARAYLLLSDLASGTPRFPVYLTVALKAGVVFDL